jgi:hypothetical protein
LKKKKCDRIPAQEIARPEPAFEHANTGTSSGSAVPHGNLAEPASDLLAKTEAVYNLNNHPPAPITLKLVWLKVELNTGTIITVFK